MVHLENTRIYKAEEGKTIRLKADNSNMGNTICLGTEDSIDNYFEDYLTEEEMAEINKSKKQKEDRLKESMEKRNQLREEAMGKIMERFKHLKKNEATRQTNR